MNVNEYEKEYIEREATKIAFQNMDAGSRVPSTLLTPEEFADYLDEIPSADVVPVRHARWISYPEYGVTKCSLCEWDVEECWYSKYCPDCGARMDGDTK